MLSHSPAARLRNPVETLTRLAEQQGERFAILTHLLAALLINTSLMLYPGSFLATPALMVALVLLLTPALGFALSLRAELEWLLVARFVGRDRVERPPLLVLLSSQMACFGLISLLAALTGLGLFQLTGSESVIVYPASLGLALFLWLLHATNRVEMKLLGMTSGWRFVLLSLAASLLFVGGCALPGWLFILALRHSLLADLSLMMMFF